MEVDQLLHILPEPALMLSLPNGVVLAVNGQFEQAFGFVITSCAGKSLAELGFWERAEQRALLTKLTTRAASGPFDLKCFSAAGSEREVALAVTVLSEDRVLLLARDVTSERKKWRDLSRTAEILQRVFDSSLDAISLTRLRDRTYLEVNEGFLRSG
ncbi:MAG: PAS domain-containing protein, partial [Deltaproteobacteria bacterium]|nr:PAS domain-containing protein [Deltaproteobacteria bacterium]